MRCAKNSTNGDLEDTIETACSIRDSGEI